MHFKWEVTLTRGNQPDIFLMGQRVNSNFEKPKHREDCQIFHDTVIFKQRFTLSPGSLNLVFKPFLDCSAYPKYNRCAQLFL